MSGLSKMIYSNKNVSFVRNPSSSRGGGIFEGGLLEGGGLIEDLR